MSDSATTYSGDVTLTGSLDAPIEIRNPDDVFIQIDGVDGDLIASNPENVFTHHPIGETTPEVDVETTVRGDLEDGYVQNGGVAGDLVVTDAEDVFVPAHATGTFSIGGAENAYSASDIDVPTDGQAYDSTTTGWRQSDAVEDPDTGAYVTGAHHTVDIDQAVNDIDVYVVGYGHEVTITGRDAAVNVVILGYENTVQVGPRLSVGNQTTTGFDNEIIDDPYPVEDLIETTKDEAFDAAGFGRSKVTYQVPATEEQWCQNCGAAADAVIERHQLDAWFLFGRPIKVYGKSMNPAMECEHCSMNTVATELSEAERKNLLG
ncbi:hypothetical protein [Halocatena pleomorpha]|uniref:Uncharacterized protein n=1 Tax=Halocatena pleomorpha TaxID=1785090 RepID=A0A3P3RM97_9EURY|nr:hypothetical protein [Halocatena pleomorpha]RRJ33523.1 hypothetical protein EIK79_01600 [Halocatena pleomorpha]